MSNSEQGIMNVEVKELRDETTAFESPSRQTRIVVLLHYSTFLVRYSIFVFFVLAGCRVEETPPRINFADCLSCHQGIEAISQNHDMACADCHLLPEMRERAELADHKAIIRNPSDPRHVNTFCMPCHEDEIGRVERSLHATMAGIINQTRYLWGAQPMASPAVYGLSPPLRPLPEPDPSVYPETPEQLVDDFLRRRCLRCHIHGSGARAEGLYRASGCAACHMPYEDDGRYRGKDAAIDATIGGYPARHQFTRKIPDSQCLRCHNHNHVGADYHGLFEHDYSRTYRAPSGEGKPAAFIYGLDQHRLARDVHAERGLWCIDCHSGRDVMGDGRIYGFQMAVPKKTCQDCHGGYGGAAPNPDSDERANGGLPMSKKHGTRHRAPRFSTDSPAHGIPAHERLRCSACHAQWSFQDYGLSVLRADRMDGYEWAHLISQGDPELARNLANHMEGEGRGDPVSKDRLTGEARLGIWLQGWRFRRWTPMPLGVDHLGRISVLRPHYQFLITYMDRMGNVPLDNAVPRRGSDGSKGWSFMPHVPHTTAPAGRSCESCHMNRTAAGLGIHDILTDDTRLRKRLMEPSDAFHIEYLKLKIDISPETRVQSLEKTSSPKQP